MTLIKFVAALWPILALVFAPLTTIHSVATPAIRPSPPALEAQRRGFVLRPSLVIPDRRFGVIETYADPASAAAIGAGWTRVRFPWADLQPNNDGEWNDAFFTDVTLAAELAAGREVVGLIVNTPFWALNDASVPGVPRGLYLPESDPGNVWATFVRQIVTRYAGPLRVDHWIIWNEPDIWDPAYPGRTWGGSVQQFFQLQRVAYNVAKQANPAAVIHLSAFTYFWDANYGRTPFFSLLMDEIQRDRQSASHNYYFDVASANLYFRVDNIYDLIAWHHGEMRARGFDKPLWLTETNAAPSSDPQWPVANPAFPISLGEQAAFIPQAFAMAIAAGADRVAVYKLIDTPGDRAANPEPFGLARDDGSRRPAFTAFQVASNYLSGFTGAALDHRDDRYAQVTVQRGEATTTVLWARSPSPTQAQVAARSTQAILADALGGARTITPRDGVYIIDLPGCTQPTCAIGGTPRLLVEGAPAAPIVPTTSLSGQQPFEQPTSLPSNPAGRAASNQPAGEPTLRPTRQPTLPSEAQAANTPTPFSSPTPRRISAFTPAPPTTLIQAPTPSPSLTLTLTPAPPASNADALVITLGIILGVLSVAFALVRASSPPTHG